MIRIILLLGILGVLLLCLGQLETISDNTTQMNKILHGDHR